ncbi:MULTISPECIES: hypothetical protein [Mesorhizobium]|uniref:hypothetical protein n=2 Tax=Phyllobacteriaceae TaxID=69277 RepID=UPI0007A94593|nr:MULTISPECIES: hypothetical protein [Mesorhizobium]RUZ92191.1 hypothetical protein EN947_01860 [Mesorhizobium sp. M7A.F.Ca.US.003.02.2.1]AMX94200.1 hypothetical protein A4R28_14435 [Mesorhizobium ciceri]MDF3208968.1 hypothetical protein [Mesorhizobium sp. LMG15046]MDF3228459.1 hypothetical protein [Mesorhizobium sp. DSM 30133]RUU20040.1 hypothetical protein EOC84_14045 [Mesorhizobium sp. Primo-B]
MSWNILAALPNIVVTDPIEGEQFSMIGSDDARLSDNFALQPNLKAFFRRFTNSHGVRITPAALVARSDTPAEFLNSEAVSGFRDAVAASIIPFARAAAITHRNYSRPMYSDSFDLYPWMVDRNGEHLIANTPAVSALHQIKGFRGLSSPGLSVVQIRDWDIDEALLKVLLDWWRKRFSGGTPHWEQLALFRSLNAANAAMQMPQSAGATIYDWGRSLSLWISAFEILVHPGPGGEANRAKVFALIERGEWEREAVREKVHDVRLSKKSVVRKAFPSYLYALAYQARNNFLHGEPVGREHLVLPSGQPVGFLVSALYRNAIATFVDLTATVSIDGKASVGAIAQAISEMSDRRRVPRTVEDAFIKAMAPKPETEDDDE